MDLKISEHNTCVSTHKNASEAQDQTSRRPGELAIYRIHLYFQLVRAVGLRPLTRARALPRPCCWNKAPTVCACSAQQTTLGCPPPKLLLRAFGPVRWEHEGGLGVYRGRNDGWAVCGNRAPARLSTCERGQCSANLQFRSPPSERERLAQSRPPLMANVIPILILDPYFSPNSLFPCQKRKKSEKRTTSAHLEGFSSIPTLPLQPH